MAKNKDFFGFNKAINWNKLKDPKVLKELEKIFEEKKLTSERASRRDNMDEIDKYRIKLNKKHYPIYWKIKDNEIEITDINNKKLPKDHEVYQAELSFIQDRISEMEFSGEIVMM